MTGMDAVEKSPRCASQGPTRGTSRRQFRGRFRGQFRGRFRRRRGFTLIELLIVIAILLGLVAIVAVNFMGASEQADIDLQRIQLETLEDALQRFRLDMKRYPYEEEGLAALWDKTLLETEEDEARWRGPYLEESVVNDKWGNELEYYAPSQLRPDVAPYDLISIGPDGEPDTADDITNHDSSRGADGEFEDAGDFTIDE